MTGSRSRDDIRGKSRCSKANRSELFAVGNQCTHQGAGLDKGVVKIAGSVKTVTCPAHGSTFNLETGKVMRPPASKPVPVYDVKVEDGRVYVRPREES